MGDDLAQRLVGGVNATYGPPAGPPAVAAKGGLCPGTCTARAAISHPAPASYAGLTYHSIHAFGFVAADDTVRYGRYHLVPESGEETITEEEAANRAPDYLREELAARFGQRPVAFGLDLQLA